MTFLLTLNEQEKKQQQINQTKNFGLSWQHWMRVAAAKVLVNNGKSTKK